jgi:hypothetical protein
MNTRGILTATSSLALLLSGAAACSSDEADSSTPSKTPSSAPSSSAPTTPAKPAVSMAGHGDGVFTDCMVPTKKGEFPDFVWTGVRLRARDAATITAVTARHHGVDVLHTWLVGGGNGNTGAIVPWSARNTFLRHLDWQHRTKATGAELTAGTPYTLVFRLRPHNGAELTDLEVHYRSSAGEDSAVDQDMLRFDKSC